MTTSYVSGSTPIGPEELDAYIADLLHQVTRRFVAWGFWMVFHYLRRQGHSWNHKRVYRIWKAEELHLRLPPKRPKISRKYQDRIIEYNRYRPHQGIGYLSPELFVKWNFENHYQTSI